MQSGSPWLEFNLPPQNSTVAGDVDGLYMFVYYLSIFFFVLIVGGMALFMWQYRRRPNGPKVQQISHNTYLEVAWSVIPTILVIFIFLWGVKGFMDMAVAPKGAQEIYVSAKKWSWSFQLTVDGQSFNTTNEIGVMKDTPVKLIMSSQDVIHSFYVPNFRIKQDVVPGRYSTLWFQATQSGENHIFCTEYCGKDHSIMQAKVIVFDNAEEYQKWVAKWKPSDEVSATYGEKLYKQNACMGCHSVDGSKVVGPTFKGIWGREEAIVGGTKVTVDESYVRESILEPNAKVVEGYPPAMPSYKGQLKDNQILSLIEYMKTLK